eukprot:CAMPEP_0116149628 /NCGR_PEP_ID=MMETSP0329-20121206/19074_1 /TAXON_ID=697910 /ORGANISM="Pseudo-nitzschia arenysensis, Strain B593" /LENGTH=83 /DNA_ID=CAMNT_0003646005 /DNA_START=40 /DNA_END=287 /DNA_ORIENTATION=+
MNEDAMELDQEDHAMELDEDTTELVMETSFDTIPSLVSEKLSGSAGTISMEQADVSNIETIQNNTNSISLLEGALDTYVMDIL